MYRIPLEEQFKYHPPKSPERIAKHDTINNAALACAKALCSCIKGEQEKQRIIDTIQQARMLANQYVTYEELAPNTPTSTMGDMERALAQGILDKMKHRFRERGFNVPLGEVHAYLSSGSFLVDEDLVDYLTVWLEGYPKVGMYSSGEARFVSDRISMLQSSNIKEVREIKSCG